MPEMRNQNAARTQLKCRNSVFNCLKTGPHERNQNAVEKVMDAQAFQQGVWRLIFWMSGLPSSGRLLTLQRGTQAKGP
jgi:hypothetical protein